MTLGGVGVLVAALDILSDCTPVLDYAGSRCYRRDAVGWH